jgi:nucleoside-diphosphate-sugar epimerase
MEASELSGEIFNVGSQNRISVRQLAERVVQLTDSDSELVFIPYEEVYGHGIEDMQHRTPSIDKITAAVGWKPGVDLERILADVIDHARHAPLPLEAS